MLENAGDDFEVSDFFNIHKRTSQSVCPTVVSMVFNVSERTIYWCENMNWNEIFKKRLSYNG